MDTRTEKHLGFRNYAHISEMVEEVVKKFGMTKTAFFNKSMREFRAHYKKTISDLLKYSTNSVYFIKIWTIK